MGTVFWGDDGGHIGCSFSFPQSEDSTVAAVLVLGSVTAVVPDVDMLKAWFTMSDSSGEFSTDAISVFPKIL